MMGARRGRMLVAALLAALLVGPVVAWAQPPAGQDEFVPASQLPAVDQLPGGPMVIAAYAFVWVALLVYVWSIWRRVQSVERDLAELSRRVASQQE